MTQTTQMNSASDSKSAVPFVTSAPNAEGHVGEKPPADPTPARPAAEEFKVTVRKLQLPVRPRGVLAE